MNYVSIVNIVFAIISGLFSLYLFHFIFFALSGVFHRKRYPKAIEKCRYGIIISAKDEENVIARLINSIREADYPQDKLDIFVIAHNCKDKTGDVAESLGAIVFRDNNENEKTLGCAYHFAFERIKDITSYDGFIFFNADNTVKKDYFNKLNDAFCYYEKKEAITTFRNTLNRDDGVLPTLYGYYFGVSCLLAFSGRNNFNVSGRITGCGFVIPSIDLVDGWNYLSITEDIEFSVNNVLKGKKVHFCYEACFNDEQPTKVKTMWNQRLRWAKGQQVISRQVFGRLVKALFSRKYKNKVSLYTFLTFHSSIVLVTFFLFLAQVIALLFSPLFNISLYDAFLYWNYETSFIENMFLSMNLGYLFNMAKALVFFIFNGFLTAIAVLIAGREYFKDYKSGYKLLALILFPLFLALQFPLDIAVLFKKEIKWKKIPHGNN